MPKQHRTFLDKGKMRKAGPSEEADYSIPHASDFFCAPDNLIPGVSGVSGGRVLLGAKASTQAISLIHREEPLVQAAPARDGKSFEQHFGEKLGSVMSLHDGVVQSITNHSIKVKQHNGSIHDYELYHNFNSGRKSYIHNTPSVGVGDHIKKGDLLATSNFTDKKGKLALGVNLTTAIMPYRSNNFEDAFVVTESGAKKLEAAQLVTTRLEKRMGVDTNKHKYISLFPNKYYNSQLDTMDEDGVVKKGTILKNGDPIILAHSPKALKTTDLHLGKLSKSLKHAFKDNTEIWDYDGGGEVTDVAKQGSLISVNIRTNRPLNVGDKLSIYSGNKGITGKILPDAEAPTTEDGKPVELILNSMSITSRVSPALISNLGIGKVAKKLGHPIKISGFVEGSAIQKAKDLMDKHGVTDIEPLYDPMSGNTIHAVVGPLYINRLVHIAEDKISDRAQGIGYDWNSQPTKAKNESAKRLGNLSTTALLSHGATAVLRDIATIRATKNDDFWRRLKLGLPAPAPKVPFIFEKFMASLHGAGIKVNRKGDDFQILPQTDKDVMAISSGPIEDAKTFKVKGQNLVAEKGGLFDVTKVGIFGTNYNHIPLNVSVPNPIVEDPIRRLLHMTRQQFEDAVSHDTIGGKLKDINVDKSIADSKKYLVSGRISERQNAVKVLSFLNTLKAHDIAPHELMVHNVPVIPAQYRPVQVAGDMTLSANVNQLYKDLILNNKEATHENLKMVPDEIANKVRLAQYHAVKATYGLGDPISVKNKEKNVKGLLAELLGTHGGSAKQSMFQARIVNKPLDLVGRTVATGDVKLDLDNISLPQDVAWKIYSPFLIRRLVRRGIPATQAKEYVTNKNPLAIQALHDEMHDRPVVLSRDPALHKFNLMGFMPKLNPDPKNKTIAVNPLVFKGFNLDLDGDQTNISAPAGDDAKEEIKDKMLPSRNLLSVRNFAPIYTPSNESALGLYQASTEDNKNKAQHFDSELAVVHAFNNGKLNAGDRVIIKKK